MKKWEKKPGVKTTHEEFCRRAKMFGFEILTKYKNNKTHVLAKCMDCGFEKMIRPDNILSGKKCRECTFKKLAKKNTLTQKKFCDRVREKVGDSYSVIGEYKNADAKILMRHNECNNEYYVTPNKFYHCGRRCPHCYNSNPEKEIKGLLISKNIEFEEQVQYQDCRNILPLRFDFKIYINNRVFLLEYQGIQHYKLSTLFGEESFKQTQINDGIKKQYCKDNNIPLEYISYNENIEDKLMSILNFYANHEPS